MYMYCKWDQLTEEAGLKIWSYNIPLSENMIHCNLTLQMNGDADSGTLQEQGPWIVQVDSS